MPDGEPAREEPGNGGSTNQTIVTRFETTLFEAFDASVYDAQLGRERYASLE